jgi:uncharacterized protein
MRNYRQHFWAAVASAVTVVFSPIAALGQVPTEKSTLWEISGNGLTKSSYLFGTIHSICREKLLIGKNQRKALDSVQQIYLEVDFDDLGTIVEAAGGIRRPGTASLKELMTPQEYRKVRNYFDKRSIPYWSISNLRPYMLTGIVAGGSKYVPGECYPSTSWEAMLVRTAKNRRLQVYGLEEPADQWAIFDQMPMKQQIAGLIEAIDNPDKVSKESEKSLATISKLYDNQDIDQMYQLIDQITFNNGSGGVEVKADRSFIEALLDQRNRNWIPKISRIIQEKPTFFGVGAGHLGGKQGVISLLRDAGYTVTPLYDNRPSYKSRKSATGDMKYDNGDVF